VSLQHDAFKRYSRENDLPIIGGKSCKKFLQNHVGAESWTFVFRSLLLLCSCWAKSNQQLAFAVEACSSANFCKFVYILLATYSILFEYLYTLLRLP
jgi:hypothetical protein